MIYEGASKTYSVDFAGEILLARRDIDDVFKVLKENIKNCKPRILSLTKLLVKHEGKTKTLLDKQC
jgi:hypothetical protein